MLRLFAKKSGKSLLAGSPAMSHRPLTRSAITLAGAAGLLAAVAGAAPEPTGHRWCGTGAVSLAERIAVSEQRARLLVERDRHGAVTAPARVGPQAARAGDVAVIVDDGSIVVHPNAVDLDERGVQYTPAKKGGGYVAAPFGDGFTDDVGDELEIGDDDVRLVAFPKGFSFPFYGATYKQMFVHSDGNVSFVRADADSSPRSLSRLLGGPPRIAPLFSDLDPETVEAEDGGVFVHVSKARAVVTWRAVPTFGRRDRNTLQLTLYANGRHTIAYGELGAIEAVVGISPGNGARAQLVDMSDGLPTGVLKTAIAERFQLTREIDDLAIAQAFFREFADDYDHLIVWFDFGQSLGGGAFAYEFTVKNEIRGIGQGVFDASAAAGSKGRLRSFVQMGSLSRYPSDPHQTFLGTNSTMDVLGQETGHRWGAFVRFVDGNGERSDALLGRDLAHWSFCMDSLASDLEGNQLQDEGSHFRTIAATDRFSPLDQYLMGLIAPGEVPPFYYVADCGQDPGRGPALQVLFAGQRVDVGVEQVVAAEGERVPAAAKAPHTFNMAFVIVTEGELPSDEAIAKVEAYRAAWEEYFPAAVDHRGDVDTTLRARGRR